MNKIKGQQEQECLDKVKNICFRKQSIYSKADDAEAIFYSGALTYGFQYNAGQTPKWEDKFSDLRPIAELIVSAQNTDFKNAKTEKNETRFPDFICTNGLIEHFQISGTKEKKDGSQIAKDRGKCDKDIDTAINNGEQHVSKVFSVHQSYDDFAASFKRNWNNHISKLRNYQGNKDNVCFMIESDGFGLVMELKSNLNYQLGITTGNIVEHYLSNREERFNSPLLGRCKELLEYIYQYKDEVQYVIFVSSNGIEIIKTDMAQYIASLLGDYGFHSAITSEYHTADIIASIKVKGEQ